MPNWEVFYLIKSATAVNGKLLAHKRTQWVYWSMAFVTSNFKKMNFWPVEHTSPVEHFFKIFVIKIRFSSNQNIGKGESNFDGKYVEKSVQLVRGSSFRNDLFQHHNFRAVVRIGGVNVEFN